MDLFLKKGKGDVVCLISYTFFVAKNEEVFITYSIPIS